MLLKRVRVSSPPARIFQMTFSALRLLPMVRLVRASLDDLLAGFRGAGRIRSSLCLLI